MSALINTSEIFTKLRDQLDLLQTAFQDATKETYHKDPLANHNPFAAFANPNTTGIRAYYYI